jgi:serine protease Do
VVTNNHVVEGADEIKVTTDPTAPGGTREYTGKVIGRDQQTDIALVQLDGDRGKQLPAAMLGSSDALEVGDYVIAIGEPFGFTATVTSGIVSAKERTLRSSVFDDFIQTDASINPGNSGGPLFNLKGEVVGVNTAIISGANSIGFAIPIDLVKQNLAQLRGKGHVTRGYLGVQVQPVTQEIAEAFGLKSAEGALVADVVRDAPASKAGLKKGDIITQVDGKHIKDERHLTRTIAAFAPSTEVRLDVFRDKGERDITVKVGTRPDESDDGDVRGEKGDQGDAQSADPLGLSVEDLNPDLARRARIEPGTKGVIITEVAPDSAASQVLEPGDVVDQVSRKPIESASDYRTAVKGLKKGDTALLHVLSHGGARYLTIHLK